MKIEKNIPVPKIRQYRNRTFDLVDKMENGDSMCFSTRNLAISVYNKIVIDPNVKSVIRTVTVEGKKAYRVWKLSDAQYYQTKKKPLKLVMHNEN